MKRFGLMLTLTGCSYLSIEDSHPDWAETEVNLIKEGKIWKGMTYNQVTCVFGTRLLGRHYHMSPSSWVQYPDGIKGMLFKITYGYWYTCFFDKDGRLQILDDFR